MSEHSKVKRFNILDFLILLFLAVILVGGGIYLYLTVQSSGDTVAVRYTILVKDVPKQMTVKITDGEDVVDTVKLNTLGSVYSYELLPCEYDTYDESTGTLHRGVYEDFNNLALTIESDATVSDEAYTVSDYDIAIGTLLYIRTAHFTGYGYVTSFEVVED